MKNTMKFGIVVVLATVLAFSNAVFAGNENAVTPQNNTTNITENMTNATNMTNSTENMTNVTNPFENAKGLIALVKRVV